MAKKKEKTKLLSLSKVMDKDDLDTVKASFNSYSQPYERAYSVLFEAQRYYNNMENFRKRRLRNKRYNYGDQWGGYDRTSFQMRWSEENDGRSIYPGAGQ